jgi:hypothetical protein
VGPEPLWELWKREKLLNPTGGRTPDHPARGLVTILTTALLPLIYASMTPTSIRTSCILQTSPGRAIVLGNLKSASPQCTLQWETNFISSGKRLIQANSLENYSTASLSSLSRRAQFTVTQFPTSKILCRSGHLSRYKTVRPSLHFPAIANKYNVLMFMVPYILVMCIFN